MDFGQEMKKEQFNEQLIKHLVMICQGNNEIFEIFTSLTSQTNQEE